MQHRENRSIDISFFISAKVGKICLKNNQNMTGFQTSLVLPVNKPCLLRKEALFAMQTRLLFESIRMLLEINMLALSGQGCCRRMKKNDGI